MDVYLNVVKNKSIQIMTRTHQYRHGEFRQENFDLSLKEYSTSILYKACRIGSIVLVETSACDILFYSVPGRNDIFMTRINNGLLRTVYNPSELQSVPRSAVKGIRVGSEGFDMLAEIVKVNQYLKPMAILLDLEDLAKVVRFELVVK